MLQMLSPLYKMADNLPSVSLTERFQCNVKRISKTKSVSNRNENENVQEESQSQNIA